MNERPYNTFYTWEPLTHEPKWGMWRLIDTKLPLANQKYDSKNPETYLRLAFHPITGKHMLLTESAIAGFRETNGTSRNKTI